MTPNVSNYLLILGSKLIDQDRKDSAREAKRGAVNVYRMGLLLEAANLVSDDMAGLGGETSMEAMAKLKKSLSRRFDPAFPPIKSMIKLIDSSPSQLKYGPRSGGSGGSAPNVDTSRPPTPAEIERDVKRVVEQAGDAKDYRVSVRVEGASKPVQISPWMTRAQAEHAAENHRAMIRNRGWTQVVEIEDKSGAMTRLR